MVCSRIRVNVIRRLISAPFRAIGSVIRRRGTLARVGIEPVTLPAGGAALTPEATDDLQDVAAFLRDKPYVLLTIDAVLGMDDMRAQAIVTRSANPLR